MTTSARSYNDAIDALNSLQTPYEVVEARRKAGVRPDASSMSEMRTYLARIGYTPTDLNRLNVIHVAGTKGKGSTCAYVDSILSQYRASHGRPRQCGLFISPHLIAVRERIRINSAPLSEALFARYFFEVWDRLGVAEPAPRPAYARYLTLMSWHVFLQQGVDVAVYETGIGGEFDATNLVPRPMVAGITTLGIDHVFALGNTVDKIAWHKAGILKSGSPAFTVEQVPAAAAVLASRARDKEVRLEVLPIDERLDGVEIRPNAAFQKKNATLAIALAEVALRKLSVMQPLLPLPPPPPPSPAAEAAALLPDEFKRGLQQTVFRGRCEVKAEEKVTWYVDGAHTADSLSVSSQWFVDETADSIAALRVLIFNQQGRTEALSFLDSIQQTTARAGRPSFDHVIFCTNVTFAETGYKRDFVNHGIDAGEVESLAVQRRYADKWASLDPRAEVVVVATIEEALGHARHLGDGLRRGERLRAYVTGSLHLVGGVLGILENSDAL